jgi:4-hydroxyphenylacetate 3-monooxygenase
MPARTGQQLIDRLRANPQEIWIGDERVADPTQHPAFRNVVASLAALYDMQHDPALRDAMTYVSPSSGERVGLSFITPRSHDDLVHVREMMKRWADFSGGMMGRAPDYLNRAVMAFGAAADYCGANDPRFGQNARRYYEYVRERDLCLTHTLINPQSNRSVGPSKQADPYLAAGIVRENADGLLIRGARMLATLPVSDEILVFPSTVLRGQAEDAPYAFAFAIPTATPGLRFICRESFDYGKSPAEHPLGSRFEEMDSVVVFDDVLVPWDRVFLLRDVERCNRAFAETRAVVHMAHQVITKDIAKTEFLLGIVCAIVDTIAIESFQHVQEKVAEVIQYLEAMRAFLRASEADAAIDRWGVMAPAWPPLDAARNMFTRMYPRMVEIIHQLGASGLMAIPPASALSGPQAASINRYYQAARADAGNRIGLFRLAWDVALSAFGSRQALYERFFFGDPVRMAGAMFANYDKAPYVQRVQAFLARAADDATRRSGERGGGAVRS